MSVPPFTALVHEVHQLRFDDGSPVRAASGVAPFGDGFLIAQDDATHAAWWLPPGPAKRLRLLPPVMGPEGELLDVFSEADGTKKWKPDFEGACPIEVGGHAAVLFLGSGSSIARNRAALVAGVTERSPSEATVSVADLTDFYAAVTDELGLTSADGSTLLNLEGICCRGDQLRLFNRGNHGAGLANASVDVSLAAFLSMIEGTGPISALTNQRTYDLGTLGGVGLAITDALSLPDGRIILSAAAEDTPNAIDDGPVVGAALAIVVDDVVQSVTPLTVDGEPQKVEGLALRSFTADAVELLAVVDSDDHTTPSLALSITLTLP